MTSRWLISSSPALWFFCAAIASGASVTGSISLIDSRDPTVRSGSNFSGVVVWLEPVGNGAIVPVRTPARTEIDQKNKRFLPHIIAVPVGSTVDFPNSDPIFHNAFSNFEGKVFDIGLYPPGTSRSVRFDRPGVVRVFCNIHPTMSAVIVVLATPYFAVTNKEGQFHISNVPAGDYIFRLFHERAAASTIESLARRVTVRESTAVIPPIEISESGFLPLRHKNKYGKQYPPAQEDSFYPGAKK
jgi:plastocyanin